MTEFLLAMKFEGVSKSQMLDEHAPRIDAQYMGRYGGAGALTVFVLDMEGPWDVVVRYAGPDDSAAWLEQAIKEAAATEGGEARLWTGRVLEDITDRF